MSANVETMFSAVKTPWHKLGVVTPDVLTAQDALVTAGLDWVVKLEPVYFQTQQESIKNIANKFAVVRETDESCYGIVGNRYTPVQNLDAFNFMDTLVDSGDAKYETAGSLNGGATIFIQMRLNTVLDIDDDVIPYMLLTNSHDGSGALKIIMTPVRVVCSNTLRMALSSRTPNQISLRHTKSISSKIDEARNILGLTELFYDSFSETVNQLINTEIDKRVFDELMNKMFPLPEYDKDDTTKIRQYNNVDKIRNTIRVNWIAEKDNGVNNGWGLLNAYNSYELWQQKVRGAKTENAKLEKQAGNLIYSDSDLTNRVAKELVKL
tara:strand:- start:10840 stop:11808 length:969 start_codon:yes stop_codon:yes gene_type:complete